MALIACNECGRQISNRATACPHCGALASTPQVIEQTAKRWKLLQLIGAVICIASFIGIVLLCGGANPDKYGAVLAVNYVLFGIGFLVAVVGRAGAWWYHE